MESGCGPLSGGLVSRSLAGGVHLFLGACGDDAQSPPGRMETPPKQLKTDEPGNLAPLDLVYACGNKFLATNSHRRTVELTWRVTHQTSGSVSVAPPSPSSITLTVSGRTDVEKHYISHLWSGASGASVDLYRNGKLVQTTPNDGRHTTAHRFKGTATWRVKVCQVGSTTACSPERSITLSN